MFSSVPKRLPGPCAAQHRRGERLSFLVLALETQQSCAPYSTQTADQAILGPAVVQFPSPQRLCRNPGGVTSVSLGFPSVDCQKQLVAELLGIFYCH